MTDYLSVQGRTFDKFCVIQHASPDCGFFALVTTVLNSIRVALKNNWLPVVNLDRQVSDYFYDAAHGENIWDYYFEPVMQLSYETLAKLVEAKQVDSALVHTFNDRSRVNQILRPDDLDSISHFGRFDNPAEMAEWMTRKRVLGRAYVAKYVHVKPHISSIVEAFYSRHLQAFHTYGVHIRGTDFGYAEPTSPETYFRAIQERVSKDRKDNIRIFLATDQEQFVDSFRHEFGSMLVTYASMRSRSEVAPFQFKQASPYRKGEDVLVDALLLAKCGFLFKCASAVGEYAMYFNPALECHDFALDSRWDPSHSAPASLKLNVNRLPPVLWRTALIYKSLKRHVLDGVIGLGRRILPQQLRDWLWMRIGRFVYFFK